MLFMVVLRNVSIVLFFLQTIESVCTSNSVCKPIVKSWSQIQSQTSKSRQDVEHGCYEVPVKIDIQIRPRTGSDKDFLFPGLGSAQRNDDRTDQYGGLIFKYGEENVIMYAPNINDGQASGSIIYTGGTEWKGPSQQKVDDAEVRVRTWCPDLFPKADFVSNMIDISGSNSFIEVPHNLGVEPQLVAVQTELGQTGYYSDGIGSMAALLPSDTWGGVIYGYDKNVVRIWTPSKNNGKIFSAKDGWGKSGEADKIFPSGRVRVRVWTSLTTDVKHVSLGRGNTMGGIETTLPVYADIDNDLVFVTVKATDGENKDFSFPASGAVQNAAPGEKYGGVVYSYSNQKVRIWEPDVSKTPYLIYINDDWGNGRHIQESKSAIATISVWKANRTGVVTIPTQKPTTHQNVATTKNGGVQTKTTASLLPMANYNKGNTTDISHAVKHKFPTLIVAVAGGSFVLLLALSLILMYFCIRKKDKTMVGDSTKPDLAWA